VGTITQKQGSIKKKIKERKKRGKREEKGKKR
jgi:hypothetical protein